MINILQANLQHSKDATSMLLKTLQDEEIKIALIQEPWLGSDGRLQGLGSFKKDIFSCPAKEKPRTCILVSGIHAILMPEFRTRDLVAVKIQEDPLQNGVVVASGYFPNADDQDPPPKEVKRLIEFCQLKQLPLLIACDANAHNELWGSTDTNPRGEALLEYLCQANLVVLNQGNVPTFRNRIREEVLDITIGSHELLTYVQNWRVSPSESLSDHEHILFSIMAETKAKRSYRTPRKTNWMQYREELQERLNNYVGSYENKDEIENCSLKITSAIIEAYEISCPLREESTRTRRQMPWWNGNLEKLRRTTCRLKNKMKRTKERQDTENYQNARTEFKKAIRAAKRTSWQAFCNEIDSYSETTRMHKILAKDRRITNVPISTGGGVFAQNDQESLGVLLRTHFPDCVIAHQAQNDQVNDQESKSTNHVIAEEVVTKEKIIYAIKKFSPFKSPGVDGVFPALLQQGLGELLPHLIKLFQAILQINYIPLEWRKVKVIFIPKPGKGNYSDAKSFRPISLTSFILKTLERCVDWSLRKQVMIERPLHNGQHAFRSGRSTETALHKLVDCLETSLDRK